MVIRQSLDVTPLAESEIVAAGEVLGRAFRTDPLWAATIRDQTRRPALLVRMFTGLVKTTLAARGVAEKTPHLGGVSVWLPPGRSLGVLALARSGFAMPRSMIRMPRSDRRRMMRTLRQVEERKMALMPRPHWYLAAIGVDPESQGKGIGTSLMRHGIARADRDRSPIYLETETERNVAFYKRLGFDVIEEFTPEDPAIPMWLMVKA